LALSKETLKTCNRSSVIRHTWYHLSFIILTPLISIPFDLVLIWFIRATLDILRSITFENVTNNPSYTQSGVPSCPNIENFEILYSNRTSYCIVLHPSYTDLPSSYSIQFTRETFDIPHSAPIKRTWYGLVLHPSYTHLPP